MADGYISQVQLPNNETYDIKDKNAITEIQIVGETQTKTNGVVNLPARVTQSNSSSTLFRPILTGYESWSSMESYTTGSVTNNIYKSAKAFLKTSNGTFYGGYFVAANPVSGGSGNTAKRATLNSDGIYVNNYLDGYSIAPYERQIIQAYAGKSRDANGLLLRIDSGGLTIVGGGESGDSLANLIANDQTVESPARLDINNSQGETGKETTAYNGSSEHLILSSDGNIYFVTGCGTIDNRVGACLNSARTFYPMTNNTGKIGSSNYKWQYGYFGQVYGTSGSGKWKAARDKASFINSTPPHENAYAPAIDLKTTSGDWSIGTLDSDENLYFAYVADSIYSGSTNVVRKYSLQAPSTPDSNTYDILHSGNTSFTQTLSSGTKIGTITINGTDTVLYCQTNTNTWRNIKVNGTEKLGTGIGTGALDFKDGTNTTVTYDSGIQINATDTKVIQSNINTTDVRPLIMENNAYIIDKTSGTNKNIETDYDSTDTTGKVYRTNNIYASPASGKLYLSSTSAPQMYLKYRTLDYTAANNNLSAAQWVGYRILDKNSKVVSMFHLEATTTGLIKTIMRATNYNTTTSSTTTGYIGVQVDKNSNVEYLISHKDKFRNAIECIGYRDEEAWLRATVGHSCKNQFEITSTTKTVGEVTFTVNKTAGTIEATDADTATASRVFTIGTFTFKPGKTYILSGCPSGGGGSSYRLYPQSLASAYYDNGEGATIIVQEEKTVNIRCIIYSANTTATVTFKPMIRDASIADDTFEPYVTPTDEKKQDKPEVCYQKSKSDASGIATISSDGDMYQRFIVTCLLGDNDVITFDIDADYIGGRSWVGVDCGISTRVEGDNIVFTMMIIPSVYTDARIVKIIGIPK